MQRISDMKEMTKKQIAAIKKLEDEADACFESDTFENCLSAIDKYVNAQMALYTAANDLSVENAKPYPHFNSSNISYKAWYAKLNDKMAKANSALANPRLAKK